jgi:hypothetical protein
MTTLTNSLNEQLFTELSSTEAELIQGGWDFTGYDGYNKSGKVLAQANFGIPDLKYPNRISSVHITGGEWTLYRKDNYKDPIVTLTPETWNLYGSYNNSTNSIKQTG